MGAISDDGAVHDGRRRAHGAVARRRLAPPVPVAAALVLLAGAGFGDARSGRQRVPAGARVDGDGGLATVALVAEVTCDPVPGPGKVQCVVRVRPVGGALRWSDAIVVAAPSFAPPLRTRVAAGDARRSDADGADFSLALAATADGTGQLEVLARATVCREDACRPVQAAGKALVVVGVSGDGKR